MLIAQLCVFATPWTIARQALLSMGFSRQEYWSGLPFPPPGDLPDSEIKLKSLMSPALAGRFFTTNTTWDAQTAGTTPIVERAQVLDSHRSSIVS